LTKEDNEKKGKKEPKPHFWIPDSEVEEVVYVPTSRPKEVTINHVEHGNELLRGIGKIKEKHSRRKTPISEELIIFKLSLEEEGTVDARGGYETIFKDNDLEIKAIKKSNEAIVSSSPENFVKFTQKLDSYIDKEGGTRKFFQHIKSISPLELTDIQTQRLADSEDDQEIMDVQVTLIPKLSGATYEKLIEYLISEIKKIDGTLSEDGLYFLSDNTPVMRFLVPSSGLNSFIDQEIILKAEPSTFFGVSENGNGSPIDITDLPMQVEEDLHELPIVCILDNGIILPNNLQTCIVDRWVADGITSFTGEHGTKVASRAIFGDNLDEQVRQGKLTPRVRVIDAVIHDGKSKLYEGTLIKRIQNAVHSIKDATTTFCLSFNANVSIEDDAVGNLAYEIDCLSRNGVNFAIPTGNHSLWRIYDDLETIADDTASRLAAPAESYYGVTVGAITRDEHVKSMSRKQELSPFSRIGYGFSGSNKPDLVYPGGNVYKDNGKAYMAANSAAYVITNSGLLVQDFGTSYSAPLAAADIAMLTNVVPNKDPFIAKGLLLHHAQYDNYSINNSEMVEKMYGLGIGNYVNSKDSYSNRATYIHKGTMSRLIKRRVKFWVPSNFASLSQNGNQLAKVNVTCLSLSPIDKGMGEEYLRGYIDASFHMINSKGTEITRNPSKGREKWKHIQNYSQQLNVFGPGDWQIWLQLYTKPEIIEDIDYVLIITIENISTVDVDIHDGIVNETANRFQALTEVQVGFEEIG